MGSTVVENASDKGTPSRRNYLQNLLRGHSGSFTGKSEGVEKMGTSEPPEIRTRHICLDQLFGRGPAEGA